MTSVNERRGALKKRSPKTEAAPAHAEPAPAHAEPAPDASEEEIVLFSEEELQQLMILDEVHSPVLADHWRDDSNDDLIADP